MVHKCCCWMLNSFSVTLLERRQRKQRSFDQTQRWILRQSLRNLEMSNNSWVHELLEVRTTYNVYIRHEPLHVQGYIHIIHMVLFCDPLRYCRTTPQLFQDLLIFWPLASLIWLYELDDVRNTYQTSPAPTKMHFSTTCWVLWKCVQGYISPNSAKFVLFADLACWATLHIIISIICECLWEMKVNKI